MILHIFSLDATPRSSCCAEQQLMYGFSSLSVNADLKLNFTVGTHHAEEKNETIGIEVEGLLYGVLAPKK